MITGRILAASVFAALAVGVLVGRTALAPRDVSRPWANAGPAAGHHGEGTGVDWIGVSSRDLAIAELFVIAQRSGVREALMRLEALAADDTVLRDLGHTLAHGLGRFAVAERAGDPAVYAQCRETFQAGCNHGVMEAYFASARAAGDDAVTPRALDALCATITRPGAARLVALECAHGMGHGLVARFHGDVRSALGACDHLSQSDARRECQDGVFMENAVRGTTSPDVRVGDEVAKPGASEHAHHVTPLVRQADPAYPCNTIDARYGASCWTYQAIIANAVAKGDLEVLVRTCESASEALRTECYRGIGKQGSGWWDDQQRVARLCADVPTTGEPACVAGAVESYLDEMWTADRAISFCGTVSPNVKPRCYEVLGARLALMHVDPAAVERDCARSDPDYAVTCSRAAVNARSRG
ncbi:MAG: hypothetical protein ACT4PJ_08890 [Gemmatimonadaceae bacterium]